MFCKSCGEPVPLDSKYCLHCGAQIINPGATDSLKKPGDTGPLKSLGDTGPLKKAGGTGPLRKPDNGNGERPVVCQYREYVLPFNQKVSYGRAWSAYDVSLYFWQNNQKHILSELNKLKAQGWETISEVGPAGFKIEESNNYFTNNFTIVEFRIKLRQQLPSG
jgi:hypothetical protein